MHVNMACIELLEELVSICVLRSKDMSSLKLDMKGVMLQSIESPIIKFDNT